MPRAPALPVFFAQTRRRELYSFCPPRLPPRYFQYKVCTQDAPDFDYLWDLKLCHPWDKQELRAAIGLHLASNWSLQLLGGAPVPSAAPAARPEPTDFVTGVPHSDLHRCWHLWTQASLSAFPPGFREAGKLTPVRAFQGFHKSQSYLRVSSFRTQERSNVKATGSGDSCLACLRPLHFLAHCPHNECKLLRLVSDTVKGLNE